MSFLHLLSSRAEQRITIHCLNISIWSSAQTQPSSPNAVRFKAWNGETLEPDVLEDTCWRRDGHWQHAVFLFKVTDTSLLPVKHIANLPETTLSSHHHLEVGPVCFL
uniref:Fibrillar collagen NC1 domain-containing protein n=2 Tax=Pygocentrus nattereri TaxID=42514 RepID=A0AAR2IQG8_PYGNA